MCQQKNHINAMHTRARVYPCELCERYFYSAGALRIHKLRNHWHGAKKHVCAHCGETFLLPIELRKHVVKKHMGDGGSDLLDPQQGDDSMLLLEEADDDGMKLEDDGDGGSDMQMPQLQAENLNMSSSSQRSSSIAASTASCYSNPVVIEMQQSSASCQNSLQITTDTVGGKVAMVE